MTTEHEVTEEGQARANRAVEIATELNKWLIQKMNEEYQKGEKAPLLLEEMVLSYAIAMSNFSIYSEVPHQKTWRDFELKALDAVRIALKHVSTQIDKIKADKRNQYNH